MNIELDVFDYTYNTPAGGSYVRVWGIPLQTISQAQNLVGMDITIYAGMQAGLPLANPKQAGIIAKGQIYQAFGNWIGTDMTLDLFIQPFVGTITKPANATINWKAGSLLETAIKDTLSIAFPGFKSDISISPNLVLANDEVGYFSSLIELAQWIKQKSIAIIDPAGPSNYQGVDIRVSQSTIFVYDGTSQTKPRAIAFQDLIGQPTWIEAPNIQFKCVMRSDIHVQDYITLPNTLVTVSQQSSIGTPIRNRPSFNGAFQITTVRHVGNFRQFDSASWVSVYNATPVNLNTQ